MEYKLPFIHPMHPNRQNQIKGEQSPYHVTSRKHGGKETQSFSHCGSFEHLGMQSLNDYKILFFILRL